MSRWVFDMGAAAYDLATDNALWREQVERLLPPDVTATRVLDLGCGPGGSAFVLAERLRGARVVAIDISSKMVARARAHRAARWSHQGQRVSLMVADALRLPFADGAFDVVTGHSFLYLVPDRGGALREARRVLRPGGVVAFMEPHEEGSLLRAGVTSMRQAFELVRRPWDASRHAASMVTWRLAGAAAGRLRPGQARALLELAGFDDVSCTPTLGGLGLHLRARRRMEA
jgi:ubiquinone/menaquinone biosynthesis C-methylase UbiE